MTQAGPAIPVIAVTDRSTDGGPALRVAVVSDGRPTEGGPARPVIVVTDGRPTQGNEPMPVVVATGAQAAQILAGPAIPVVVVSGSGLGGSAPVNTVLPAVSGTTELGQTLTATTGTWTGDPVPTFTYQWYRNGVAIGGATNTTYVLVAADMGTVITVVVTATNAVGAVPATSAGTPILNWILLDRFTTAQAAPLTTPRTCEPGPGTLTIVDTTNKLTINASNRLIASGANVAWTDPRVTSALIARRAGRVLATKQKGGAWQFGFANTADTSPRAGVQTFAGNFYLINNGVGTVLVGMVGTTDYEFLYIQSNIGAYIAIKGGAWAAWTLLWPCMYNTANNKIGSQKISWGVNASSELDYIEEYDLGGIWSRSYGFASYAAYKPAMPTTLTATADLVAMVTWTAIAGSTDMDLCIRYTDDNNCWIVRLTQSDNTIKLIEKVAGVETARISVAYTAGAASINPVVIRAEAQRISIGASGTIYTSYTSASFNQTVADVKLQSSTSTPFYFFVWPLAVPALPTSTGTLPLNLYPYGDSLTVGTGDDAIYGTLGTGYPWMVCEATEASRGAGCFERPTRTAAGGRTTATAKAAIDAELAAIADTPDYILYNLGANDIGAMPVQATWQTNALYIWDAMHVKWPSAQIHVMKVWIRNQNANADTYDDTWLPTAVALRSSFVFLHAALDERIILEAGDNGVTYTTDGIHPNHAGYIRMATAWKTALGI